jgi:hypothetical protein
MVQKQYYSLTLGMATLCITAVETNKQFTPTFYELRGVSDDPTENNYYYSVVCVASSRQSLEKGFVYCCRKMDFSRMADNDVKKIKGVTITNHKDPTTNISMDSNALQCLAWGEHPLASLLPNNINRGKKLLPHYLLASDLTQLKENVLFYVLWENNSAVKAGTAGTFFDITLGLFPDNA